MIVIDNQIIEILKYRKQNRLVDLLFDSEYDFNESSSYGSKLFSTLTTVNIYSPIRKYEKLINITEEEKEEIIKAFHVPYPVKANDIEINDVEFFVHPINPNPKIENGTLQQSEYKTDYWVEGYFKIFVSHSSVIKKSANLLSESFEKFAISGFVAHDDIEPSREWQIVIEDALVTCDCIVAILNPDFGKSKWTDQEIGIGYGLKKTIIPVRLGVDPYGFMGKYQGIQGINRDMSNIASEIFELLLKNDKTKEKLSRAIIHKFINSYSFANAKYNFDLLTNVTYMNKKLLEDLRKSKEENNQIALNFTVPYKLDNFIKEWEKRL